MSKINSISIFLIFCFLAVQLFAQNNQQKSLNVTVYNSDLGVIKEVRSIDLNKGISQIKITDVAENIDPTSVHIKFDGSVLEQNYQYDLVSMTKILKKYLDKKITLLDEKGNLLEGTLLTSSSDQIVLKKSDGGLMLLPNIVKYRIDVGNLPEGLITKPTLIWSINSNKSGNQDVELSYHTSGMNWHAEYVAILNNNDTKADLNAWVSVDNRSGTTYKDANLKLVAGDVNRVADELMVRGARFKKDMAPIQAYGQGDFEEKAFFEYHIYNLQRPVTLANNETKQISLFEASNISILKKYVFYDWGENIEKGKVNVVIEFENSKKNNLGIPMPKGKVRLNKSDGSSIEFIGEDMIDHTPKDEKIKLKVGEAFDIVVDEKLTDSKSITDKVRESTYELTLKNRKDEDVEVDVQRNLYTNWELLESTHKYEKKDASTIIFKVSIPKGKEVVLKYKVRWVY